MNESYQPAPQTAPNYPPHPANLPPAPGWPIHPAMVTSALELPGFRIVRSLGIFRGLTVRSPSFGGSIQASLESIGGGKQHTYTELCERARAEAFFLMLQHAAEFGANAIIGFRYDTTEIASVGTEVLAYGTAVWAEPVG